MKWCAMLSRGTRDAILNKANTDWHAESHSHRVNSFLDLNDPVKQALEVIEIELHSAIND